MGFLVMKEIHKKPDTHLQNCDIHQGLAVMNKLGLITRMAIPLCIHEECVLDKSVQGTFLPYPNFLLILFSFKFVNKSMCTLIPRFVTCTERGTYFNIYGKIFKALLGGVIYYLVDRYS